VDWKSGARVRLNQQAAEGDDAIGTRQRVIRRAAPTTKFVAWKAIHPENMRLHARDGLGSRATQRTGLLGNIEIGARRTAATYRP